MTIRPSTDWNDLAKRLLDLADRLPTPWEEDRPYGEREIARLNADVALVRDAANALGGSDEPQYEPFGFVWEGPAGKTFHEVAPKTSLFSFTEVFKRTDAARENK